MRLQGQNFCLNNLTGLITMQETVWGKQKNQTQKKGFVLFYHLQVPLEEGGHSTIIFERFLYS